VAQPTRTLQRGGAYAAGTQSAQQLAGMRDALIHAYFGVDLGVIWRVLEDEVPDRLLFTLRFFNELSAK
jgi:uncharacterized protein with HEPN domain